MNGRSSWPAIASLALLFPQARLAVGDADAQLRGALNDGLARARRHRAADLGRVAA